MNWSKGFFRVWVLLSVLWVVGVLAISAKEISNPRTFKIGFLMDGNGVPSHFGEWSDEYDAALKRKSAGELQEIEIEKKDVLKNITLFMPKGLSDEEISKRIDADFNLFAQVAQDEKDEARRGVILKTASQSLILPVIFLVFGMAIRWVIIGFRTARGEA